MALQSMRPLVTCMYQLTHHNTQRTPNQHHYQEAEAGEDEEVDVVVAAAADEAQLRSQQLPVD